MQFPSWLLWLTFIVSVVFFFVWIFQKQLTVVHVTNGNTPIDISPTGPNFLGLDHVMSLSVTSDEAAEITGRVVPIGGEVQTIRINAEIIGSASSTQTVTVIHHAVVQCPCFGTYRTCVLGSVVVTLDPDRTIPYSAIYCKEYCKDLCLKCGERFALVAEFTAMDAASVDISYRPVAAYEFFADTSIFN